MSCTIETGPLSSLIYTFSPYFDFLIIQLVCYVCVRVFVCSQWRQLQPHSVHCWQVQRHGRSTRPSPLVACCWVSVVLFCYVLFGSVVLFCSVLLFCSVVLFCYVLLCCSVVLCVAVLFCCVICCSVVLCVVLLCCYVVLCVVLLFCSVMCCCVVVLLCCSVVLCVVLLFCCVVLLCSGRAQRISLLSLRDGGFMCTRPSSEWGEWDPGSCFLRMRWVRSWQLLPLVLTIPLPVNRLTPDITVYWLMQLHTTVC